MFTVGGLVKTQKTLDVDPDLRLRPELAENVVCRHQSD
jgi:hypothetical protein